MSWTGELFCPLRVTVHRVAYWQIWQFVISCSFAHCWPWDELFNMIIVQYIYYDHRVWYMHVACMVEGKSYMFGENLYLSEQQIQVFSPLFTDNTYPNWFQLDSSTTMYSRGKIFKWGELETTVWVISLQKNYKITLTGWDTCISKSKCLGQRNCFAILG